jgi:hypothetical protein
MTRRHDTCISELLPTLCRNYGCYDGTVHHAYIHLTNSSVYLFSIMHWVSEIYHTLYVV